MPPYPASPSARARVLSWFLPLLLTIPRLGSAADASNLFPDPVLARGKGVLVRRSELEDAFTAYSANRAANERPLPERERSFREAQLLERLALTQILIGRTTDADRAKAREAAVKILAESKNSSTSEETFARRLKALGMSMDQYNVRIMEEALARAVIEREVQSKVTISDAAVDEFYRSGVDVQVKLGEAELARAASDPSISPSQMAEAKARLQRVREFNLARFEKPETARVSHIFLTTRSRVSDGPLPEDQLQAKRRRIEQLLARARAGEDFAKLIAGNSEDINLPQTRGEYVVSRDSRFAPEFLAAAFSLEPGKISDIVTSFLGFHILKLHEKTPAKKLPLKDVAAEARELLREQELQVRLPEYFARLKKEAALEILDSKYAIPLPKDLDALPPGG